MADVQCQRSAGEHGGASAAADDCRPSAISVIDSVSHSRPPLPAWLA